MDHSESVANLAAALVDAMGELQNVVADTANPFFKSRYASLPSILDSVRPVLAKHGLSVVQLPVDADGKVGVESLILHRSGEWMTQTLMVSPQKDDPQGYGSAITYCRRYALAAILGIGQDDDDGNAASQPQRTVQPKPRVVKSDRQVIPEAGGREFMFEPEDEAPPEPKWRTWRQDTVSKNEKSAMHGRTWQDMLEGEHGGARYKWLRYVMEKQPSPNVAERALYVLWHIERNERARRQADAHA